MAFPDGYGQIIIPQLFSHDSPESVPVFNNNNNLTMSLEVKKLLPMDIAPRLIVKCYEDIKDENEIWRTGAVLYYNKGDATALVTAEDGRRIIIKVKGKDSSRYISKLRDIIANVFENYGV